MQLNEYVGAIQGRFASADFQVTRGSRLAGYDIALEATSEIVGLSLTTPPRKRLRFYVTAMDNVTTDALIGFADTAYRLAPARTVSEKEAYGEGTLTSVSESGPETVAIGIAVIQWLLGL